jgi:hypothetical protein
MGSTGDMGLKGSKGDFGPSGPADYVRLYDPSFVRPPLRLPNTHARTHRAFSAGTCTSSLSGGECISTSKYDLSHR